MARNLRKYGYGPNRSSDMPARIRVARDAFAAYWADRRRRNVDEQRAAIEPMTLGERTWAYMRQNGGARSASVKANLTPRQMRRMRHKSKLGVAVW